MRAAAFLLALLLALPACARSQAAPAETLYPMLMIDEVSIDPNGFTRAEYPVGPWNDAQACLEEMGYVVPAMDMPELLIVPPPTRSFRVADYTRDSLGVYGHGFGAPTYAYALIHTHAVLILQHDSKSFRTLRHEAIHIMLWKASEKYGHPAEEFDTCDKGRAVPN